VASLKNPSSLSVNRWRINLLYFKYKYLKLGFQHYIIGGDQTRRQLPLKYIAALCCKSNATIFFKNIVSRLFFFGKTFWVPFKMWISGSFIARPQPQFAVWHPSSALLWHNLKRILLEEMMSLTLRTADFDELLDEDDYEAPLWTHCGLKPHHLKIEDRIEW